MRVLPFSRQHAKAWRRHRKLLQRRTIVSGDRLTDASAGFDQQTGQPVVSFRFDSVGARQFGDVTKENVNHRFAIVLDKQVIIRTQHHRADPGRLRPNHPAVGTTETANDLAILLRAGALPVPLHIMEERTVGAELGADSINAGRLSAIAGLAMVGAVHDHCATACSACSPTSR